MRYRPATREGATGQNKSTCQQLLRLRPVSNPHRQNKEHGNACGARHAEGSLRQWSSSDGTAGATATASALRNTASATWAVLVRKRLAGRQRHRAQLTANRAPTTCGTESAALRTMKLIGPSWVTSWRDVLQRGILASAHHWDMRRRASAKPPLNRSTTKIVEPRRWRKEIPYLVCSKDTRYPIMLGATVQASRRRDAVAWGTPPITSARGPDQQTAGFRKRAQRCGDQHRTTAASSAHAVSEWSRRKRSRPHGQA